MLDLFHSCQNGVQSDNVCPEIAAVGAGVFVTAVGQESVVAPVPVVKLHNPGRIRICGKEVAGGPGGWWESIGSADQSIILEGVGTDTFGDLLRRRAFGSAAGGASA
jgi:hypothetical protein